MPEPLGPCTHSFSFGCLFPGPWLERRTPSECYMTCPDLCSVFLPPSNPCFFAEKQLFAYLFVEAVFCPATHPPAGRT